MSTVGTPVRTVTLSPIGKGVLKSPPKPSQTDQNSKAISALWSGAQAAFEAMDAVVTFINRELIPAVRETIQRFNERHGTTVITDADYAIVEPVETVIATAAVTVTLPASSGWTRYITLIANGGDITVAVPSTDTNNGTSTVTSIGSAVMVPDGANNEWYGG